MRSSSSDNSEVAENAGHSEEKASISRLFNIVLACFFVVQVVIGVAVIIFFIGGEFSDQQREYLKSNLRSHGQAFESFVEDRMAVLDDYAKLPAIIAGTMNPGQNKASLADFLSSLFILKEKAYFALQDFQGESIYSDQKIAGFLRTGGDFDRIMVGDSEGMLDVVTLQDTAEDCCFWRLSVPVKYHGSSEGVLTAFIPFSPSSLFRGVSEEGTKITVIINNKVVGSMGEAGPPLISQHMRTGYPNVVLKQEASTKEVDAYVRQMVMVMVFALVLGTLVLMGVIHVLGRRFFIVPHARLKAMSDELEKEVDRRTEDLKMRTVQLSMEIRERRDAELEAQETGQLVSALLEGIEAAFFIINPETGVIARSNSVVHDMLGYSPWQIDNAVCSDVFGSSSDVMADLLCPFGIRRNSYSEGVAYHKDGHSFPVARYLVQMELKGKEHIGVILLDITERKNLERRLNIAQKLESVGELASGIAHEINTPIQYVGDSVRFVKEAFEDIMEIMAANEVLLERCREAGFQKVQLETIEELHEEADLEFVMQEVPKACDRALDGTDRVAVIVRAMKNFAHPGDGEKKAVDINQALVNTIIVAKNEWKYVAEVVEDFDFIPVVHCLPGDINQVFLNIIVNAAHAIGEKVGADGGKGTITVSTRKRNDHVLIKIADTGNGIPKENRTKIFDPFFTTKEVGRGTGQGLAIVHDIIVERHGGTIDFQSEAGEGTTFLITLPLIVNEEQQ